MGFALNPDDGPARILRFRSPDAMPSADTLFVLDVANNLLLINQPLFEQLNPTEKQAVITTHEVRKIYHEAT